MAHKDSLTLPNFNDNSDVPVQTKPVGADTPDAVDYADGTEPTNKIESINKMQINIDGSLSQVYTQALQAILNKKNGVNEFQLDAVQNGADPKDSKGSKKDSKAATESQQQSVDTIIENSVLTNDSAYYKSLDDESVDPDYYYSYIGKNSDINNSEAVVNTINRIINGYNSKYISNNSVMLENNAPISKHIVLLSQYLDTKGIQLRFVENKLFGIPILEKQLKLV
jgi:hypothetical protein